MWIMLLKKLPTEVSPPRASMHWAGASAEDVDRSRKQKRLAFDNHKHNEFGSLIDEGDRYFDALTGFGYEPKEEGAVWIIFDNFPIKVWPHEYTVVDDVNMELYTQGEDQDWTMSHLPMYGRVPLFAEPITLHIDDKLDKYPGFDRDIYDAAMVDGQNNLQAFYTAIGGYRRDLWFSLGNHYGNIYGYSDSDLMPVYKSANPIYEHIKSGWNEAKES